MEKQIKSKKRVADHGEVFTAEREVNAIVFSQEVEFHGSYHNEKLPKGNFR